MKETKEVSQPQELDEDELEKVVGGAGLRDVNITETKDIDESIKGRI